MRTERTLQCMLSIIGIDNFATAERDNFGNTIIVEILEALLEILCHFLVHRNDSIYTRHTKVVHKRLAVRHVQHIKLLVIAKRAILAASVPLLVALTMIHKLIPIQLNATEIARITESIACFLHVGVRQSDTAFPFDLVELAANMVLPLLVIKQKAIAEDALDAIMVLDVVQEFVDVGRHHVAQDLDAAVIVLVDLVHLFVVKVIEILAERAVHIHIAFVRLGLQYQLSLGLDSVGHVHHKLGLRRKTEYVLTVHVHDIVAVRRVGFDGDEFCRSVDVQDHAASCSMSSSPTVLNMLANLKVWLD
mmetsp:Transcript_20032/g.31818  ORF Transcript_20032/g.31818 Transcript_20032/m.31818 type:complete len:305 (-) Transcript_20032:470-1384(-)